MVKISRYHDISMGHRVYGHEGACKFIHGHNYRFHFTLEPVDYDHHFTEDGTSTARDQGLDRVGRVIDFSVIKSKLCQWLEDNWDHKMILWEMDPIFSTLFYYLDADAANALVKVPFNPTAENIAIYMVEVLGPKLLDGSGVYLQKCVVEETRKCSATAEMDCPPIVTIKAPQLNAGPIDYKDLPF